jgi:ABC-type transporter Mla MlaB component
VANEFSRDGSLVLDGALTVRNAPAIGSTLLEAIRAHPVVSIDCSAATELDLSFIQLLLAARLSAVRLGRLVGLAAAPDGMLLDALTRGGFHPTEPAAGAADGFWFEGAVG